MYLYVLNAFSIPKKSGALPEPYLVVRLSDKLTRNVGPLLCSSARTTPASQPTHSSTFW